MPVVLNGTILASSLTSELGELFDPETRRCLLICGEGGAGKTSLACLLGRRIMGRSDESPVDHPILFVLLEEELENINYRAGSERLFEAVRSKLTALVDASEPIETSLLRRLLLRKRVAVVIDHFTELSASTQAQISPESADFPIGALIVTARSERVLKGASKDVLTPLRVAGNRLTSFMELYLTQCGKREEFGDDEFIEACLHLTRIVGARDVTALLAKMFADQLIARRSGGVVDDLPRSIPEMMLKYVAHLHHDQDDKATIRRSLQDCKTVAWACLRSELYPARAPVRQVLDELGGSDGEERLHYLESYLHIVATDGVELNQVRFVLDPLAEYLAALYAVEQMPPDSDEWAQLSGRFVNSEERDAQPSGFAVALVECRNYDEAQSLRHGATAGVQASASASASA